MAADSLKHVPAEAVEMMALKAGEDPRKLAVVADLARRSGLGEQAYLLSVRARQLAGDSAAIIAATARAYSESVPEWHFHIVRDELRNAAYEEALRRAVTPDSLVLDIGTGSGLLSLMAARAGAGQVISCELNRAVADAASDIVALNGYSDRIRVVAAHSTALDIEALCGRRADIIVSEIVSNDLVAEGAMEAMADAVDRLLAPGGKVIPASGEVRVALARWDKLDDRELGLVSGFDLAPFSRLRRRPHRIEASDPSLVLVSEARTLVELDLSHRPLASPLRASVDFPPPPERANGVAQWIRLHLDGDGSYENDPALRRWSCWAILFHPFASVLDSSRPVRVHCARMTEHLDIWASEASA